MIFFKNTPILLLLVFQLQAHAQVGNPAPNFTVTDTEGNTHELYDYLEAGRVVVLDFYYTTCGPCQFYSPQVNLAFEKYGCNTAATFFMAIDYNDTNAEVIAYDAQYGIQYPSVSGTQGGGNAVVNLYGVTGFPTFYVIDSTKTIIAQIDPPTLQVFDFRFAQHGIEPAECAVLDAGEPVSTNKLRIFPNPAGAETVSFDLPDGVSGTLEIFDSMGRAVRRESIRAGEPAGFSGAALRPGIYIVRFAPEDGGGLYGSSLVRI